MSIVEETAALKLVVREAHGAIQDLSALIRRSIRTQAALELAAAQATDARMEEAVWPLVHEMIKTLDGALTLKLDNTTELLGDMVDNAQALTAAAIRADAERKLRSR